MHKLSSPVFLSFFSFISPRLVYKLFPLKIPSDLVDGHGIGTTIHSFEIPSAISFQHLLESQSLSSSFSGIELRKTLRSLGCGLGVRSSPVGSFPFPPRISVIINFDRGG